MLRIWTCYWRMLVVLALPFTSLAAQAHTTGSPVADSILRRGIGTDLALDAASLRDPKARALFQRAGYEAGFDLQGTMDERWALPALRVWVAFPASVDHWHRYTVAEYGGRVFRLGGFQAPELLAIDRSLGSAAGGLPHRAALLAALADPNGAERLVVSDTATSSLGAAGTFVTLKAVAFEPNAYAAHWEGYRYAFLFSPNGKLVEWSREELPDVKAPTAAR